MVLVFVLIAPIYLGAWLQAQGIPAFWPLYLTSTLVMLLLFWRLRLRPTVVVVAMATWFATHKLLVAIAAPVFGASETAWLQNYKEGMYLTLFAVGLWAATRSIDSVRSVGQILWGTRWADRFAVGFLVLVTLYFLLGIAISPDDLKGELVYARRFASLPIVYLGGRLLIADGFAFRLAIRYFAGLAVVVAAFGLTERLLLGDAFWTQLVHVETFRASVIDAGFGSEHARLIDGLPANWFSYLDGTPVRRLVSTFLEPTTLALFLALAFALATFAAPVPGQRHRVGWLLTPTVIGLALLLTIGKGGYLAVAVMGLVVGIRASRSSALRVLAAVLILVAAALLLGQLLPVGTNIDRHLRGLFSGLGQLLTHPLGGGLGSTGFWGDQRAVGTDSTAGAIASQVGLVGVTLYAAWLGATAWRLLPRAAGFVTNLTGVQRTLAGSIIALLVVGVVSNSASGLLAGFFYAILAGWAISIDKSSASVTST